MSAAKNTPTTLDDPSLWRVCAGDPTFIAVPSIVKVLNVGSAERAAFIVRACNSHDALVRALVAAYLKVSASRFEEFSGPFIADALDIMKAALLIADVIPQEKSHDHEED